MCNGTTGTTVTRQLQGRGGRAGVPVVEVIRLIRVTFPGAITTSSIFYKIKVNFRPFLIENPVLVQLDK